jgi:hypothetical protein
MLIRTWPPLKIPPSYDSATYDSAILCCAPLPLCYGLRFTTAGLLALPQRSIALKAMASGAPLS